MLSCAFPLTPLLVSPLPPLPYPLPLAPLEWVLTSCQPWPAGRPAGSAGRWRLSFQPAGSFVLAFQPSWTAAAVWVWCCAGRLSVEEIWHSELPALGKDFLVPPQSWPGRGPGPDFPQNLLSHPFCCSLPWILSTLDHVPWSTLHLHIYRIQPARRYIPAFQPLGLHFLDARNCIWTLSYNLLAYLERCICFYIFLCLILLGFVCRQQTAML